MFATPGKPLGNSWDDHLGQRDGLPNLFNPYDLKDQLNPYDLKDQLNPYDLSWGCTGAACPCAKFVSVLATRNSTSVRDTRWPRSDSGGCPWKLIPCTSWDCP